MISETETEEILTKIRALADLKFPSPFRRRSYQFPQIYPSATTVRNLILDPLGVFLFGLEMEREGVSSRMDLEQLVAQFVSRVISWRCDFPLYLLTPGLVDMLINTDRLDQPNVDEDSRPPFQSGHFVLPKHFLGTPNGAYATVLTWAVIAKEDYEDMPVQPPSNMEGRRLYVTVETSGGEAYFARLRISDQGTVENPKESPYKDFVCDDLKAEGAAGTTMAKFVYDDGPDILAAAVNLCLSIFTMLNMPKESHLTLPAALTGIAKGKKGKPDRQFWSPATIGVGLIPTGLATQGSHASPHAHLRRGHMKGVRFGVERKQVKRVWIRPTLVKGKPELDDPGILTAPKL